MPNLPICSHTQDYLHGEDTCSMCGADPDCPDDPWVVRPELDEDIAVLLQDYEHARTEYASACQRLAQARANQATIQARILLAMRAHGLVNLRTPGGGMVTRVVSAPARLHLQKLKLLYAQVVAGRTGTPFEAVIGKCVRKSQAREVLVDDRARFRRRR